MYRLQVIITNGWSMQAITSRLEVIPASFKWFVCCTKVDMTYIWISLCFPLSLSLSLIYLSLSLSLPLFLSLFLCLPSLSLSLSLFPFPTSPSLSLHAPPLLCLLPSLFRPLLFLLLTVSMLIFFLPCLYVTCFFFSFSVYACML